MPSRPSYRPVSSPRPSYRPSTRPASSKYRGSRSNEAAFFYRYPITYYSYVYYLNNPSLNGCDTDEIKVKLSNGTIVDDKLVINSWKVNSTLYENITKDAQVYLPCEKLNMASILGISLGIGIPILLIILCCIMNQVCIGCKKSNNIDIQDYNPTKVEQIVETEYKSDNIDKTVSTKPYVSHNTSVPYVYTIPKKRELADNFLQDSSFVRHIAKILDNNYCIPHITYNWLEYNVPSLHSDVCLWRAEGLPEKTIAIKVIQYLIKTPYVTEKEKTKLKQLYLDECSTILSDS